jgi:hypothetical protein
MATVSLKAMQGLEATGIITIKGISGKATTVETAAKAPRVCQAHALSGNVYDLEFDGEDFIFIENTIVYKVEQA